MWVSKGTCLVIGGGGFIGSHLVPRLLAGGRKVTVLGRSAAPRHVLPAGAAYVAGNFGDADLIRSLLESHGEVIHLAYATVPNTSFDNPLGDLLENLPATVQLFTAVAARGRRLVLVSSGGTVYGEGSALPIAENHPTLPISPYGVTKLTLEKYAYLYFVTHGLNVVSVRPANAFGEGQAPFSGQGFVATAIASALRGQAVRIFGPHGTVRDYIHVVDLAEGIVSALEQGATGQTYNLGSGVGRSNLQVIEAIRPLLMDIGCEVATLHEPARVFDVRNNVLDSSRLRIQTGWMQKIGFEEGLLRTRDWLRNCVA
ncbi:MAG: NAD-dependent epimerase/dehydratase family protein [Rhodocyclales bacterium]|nr:NAD-dependent epimerase/dehydratase family protein [Rhodocyclales bacterium]